MLKVKNKAELRVLKGERQEAPPAPVAAPAIDPAALAHLQHGLAQVAEGVARLPELIAAARPPAPAPVKKMSAQVIRDKKGRMDRIEITVIS